MNKSAIVYFDINNLFHRYKKLDFIKLREWISRSYNIVRCTAYSAISFSEESQRKFLTYMSNNEFRCQTVDISQNTDCDNIITYELCNDYSILDYSHIIFVLGDGDFFYPLSELSKKGKFIHIIGPKENTSLELLKICDKLTYLEEIKNIILEK